MTKIIAMLRLLKRQVDANDAELASKEFCNPVEFMKHFSYRKGGKLFPLKDLWHIARLYRKLKGKPSFGDFEEDIEEDLNEVEAWIK